MTPSSKTPVSNTVLECARILARAVQVDQSRDSNLRLDLENILVRLKIWAGNVGVFAPDNASLDYRLRDDPDLGDVLLSMVAKLKQSLNKALCPPLTEEASSEGDEPGEKPGGRPSSVCSGSSSDSLSLDSDAEESSSNLGQGNPDTSTKFIKEANRVIDRLYRLTTAFRKPVSSTENARIREFVKKLKEKGETEELEDIEDHAWSHIKARFPHLPDVLVNRLVEAVVFRRMKIRYRQRHQAKLHQGLEPAFATPAPNERHLAQEVAGGAVLSGSVSGKQDGSSSVKSKSHAPAPRSVAFSATNASSVNRARFADYARSAALSGITRAAVGRRQQLDVPPPPEAEDDVQDKAECPYCLRLIKLEEMKEPRWTRHILKDIDPYVCLFEDCKENHALFKTIEEWLGHLRWQHTIIYSCQAAGHEREVFDSREDLENHIRSEHPHTFTESQLPGLVAKGALPAPNTLSNLNLSHSVTDFQCLMCRNFDSQVVDVHMQTTDDGTTPEQRLQDHILGHLESIALLALPDQGDAHRVDSNVRLSSHDSDIAVQRETENLPSATFEDIAAGGPGDESVPDQDDNGELWAAVFRQIKQSRLPDPRDDSVLIELAAQRKPLDDQAVAQDVMKIRDKMPDEALEDQIPSQSIEHTGADQAIAMGKYTIGPGLWERVVRATSIAFSSEGRLVATVSYESSQIVKLWDAQSGSCTATLAGHSGSIKWIAFSPDGYRVATGSIDETVRLWDAQSGAYIATLEGHSLSIQCAAFSPDGSRLATGSRAGTVQLWPASGAQGIAYKALADLEGHIGSTVNCIAFSADGCRLVSAFSHVVKLWDTNKGVCTTTFELPDIICTALSYDGRYIATARVNAVTTLYDTVTGFFLWMIIGRLSSIVSIAFSPDGRRVASGFKDQIIVLWDTQSGERIDTPDCPFCSQDVGALEVNKARHFCHLFLQALPWPDRFVSDEDDSEDDDVSEQGDATNIWEDIAPDFAGFKKQVLRMNPKLSDQNTYLVDHIAHQQVVRYKALLGNRVRHRQLVSSRTCPSGSMCIDQGGSPVSLDVKGEKHDDSDADDDPWPYFHTAEDFPPNFPTPPSTSLPAEFECQICYQTKKIAKPSDWTKHVHEDVQPFSCTWDRCHDPKIFKRKADWLRHENEGHRVSASIKRDCLGSTSLRRADACNST